MHFYNSLLQISTLAILALKASAAVEIRFYWDAYGCGTTSYSYWYDIPSATCYGNNGAGSYGTEFINVPSGAKGQIYNDYPGGCSNYLQGGGSGTYCLNAGFAYSANWFYPYKKLARDTPEDSDGQAVSGFQYATAEGGTRRISCPPEDFKKVYGLVVAGDYAALAEYPDGKSSLLVVNYVN